MGDILKNVCAAGFQNARGGFLFYFVMDWKHRSRHDHTFLMSAANYTTGCAIYISLAFHQAVRARILYALFAIKVQDVLCKLNGAALKRGLYLGGLVDQLI